jgi:hypothetical protein
MLFRAEREKLKELKKKKALKKKQKRKVGRLSSEASPRIVQ